MSKAPEPKNLPESGKSGELQVRPGLLKCLTSQAQTGGKERMKMELNVARLPITPHPRTLASLHAVGGVRPLKTADREKLKRLEIGRTLHSTCDSAEIADADQDCPEVDL